MSCTLCSNEIVGRGPRAKVCSLCLPASQLYKTTKANLASGFNRKKKGSPPLAISEEDFCRWRRETPQVCAYCGICEEDIPKVGMRSQIQRPVRTMGVDRVDSRLGYSLDNMVPCCFWCNQIKGDRFSSDEMKGLGVAMRSLWSSRLQRDVSARP